MTTLFGFVLLTIAIALGYQLHALVVRAHFDEAIKNQRICINCVSRLKQELISLKFVSKEKGESIK